MVATARPKTKQTWRGFNFPACGSIYRYQVSYKSAGFYFWHINNEKQYTKFSYNHFLDRKQTNTLL